MARTLTGLTRTCNRCGYTAATPIELWFHWQVAEWEDSLHDNGAAYTPETAPLFAVHPAGVSVEVSKCDDQYTVFWVTATFAHGHDEYPSLAAALERVAAIAREREK